MIEANGSAVEKTPSDFLEKGWTLKSWIAAERAGFPTVYNDKILAAVHEVLSQCGTSFSPQAVHLGKPLLFAWDETNEEQYRYAADAMAAHIESADIPATPANLLAVEPFRAEYDTRFGGRQAYKTIVSRFQSAQAENASRSLREKGEMLMALADTIEMMDMQVYEHYRALADMFLTAARDILPCLGKLQDKEWTGRVMIITALLKGIRLGLLDPEKYGPPALDAFIRLEKWAEEAEKHPSVLEKALLLLAQIEVKEAQVR